MLRDLPTDQITRRADARAVNSDTVSGLVDSIGAVGLINPIRVRQSGEGWEVIAGVHRLEACKALGLAEVACDVVTDDDLHAELAMIDENLCRAELSPSDRARQTARRKAIYIELHPETEHGANLEGAGVAKSATPETPRFTAATAAVTGQSERTVRLDAERGQKILPEVLDMIRGTKLDTGTYMDKLKSMPGSDQFKAAQRDLLHLRHQERVAMQARTKIKVADAPLNDEAAQERQVAALMSAWNKASAEARQEFMDRIDVPVMDRNAAFDRNTINTRILSADEIDARFSIPVSHTPEQPAGVDLGTPDGAASAGEDGAMQDGSGPVEVHTLEQAGSTPAPATSSAIGIAEGHFEPDAALRPQTDDHEVSASAPVEQAPVESPATITEPVTIPRAVVTEAAGSDTARTRAAVTAERPDFTKPNPACADPDDCGVYASWEHPCGVCLRRAQSKRHEREAVH